MFGQRRAQGGDSNATCRAVHSVAAHTGGDDICLVSEPKNQGMNMATGDSLAIVAYPDMGSKRAYEVVAPEDTDLLPNEG